MGGPASGNRRPPGPEGRAVTVTARIPEALRAAIVEEAAARGIAVQRVIEHAVRAELARCGRYTSTATSDA